MLDSQFLSGRQVKRVQFSVLKMKEYDKAHVW
jgi:hypothetical protein